MNQTTVSISTQGRGLSLITPQVLKALSTMSVPTAGLLNCFIQHTSCSLLIQENADPSAKRDLETFLNRLAPDGESWHEHVAEGPDDTTSHIKSALTATSLNIPIISGELGLGTWQGLYLWEHRTRAHQRRLVLTLLHS